VGGGEVVEAAVVAIEEEVVFEEVVGFGEAEEFCGAVNGGGGAFEFGESADGSFVDFDEEAFGPFVGGGQAIGGAKFLVAEPVAKAEASEDFFEWGGVGEGEFEFFADFVGALARGALSGRGFEG